MLSMTRFIVLYEDEVKAVLGLPDDVQTYALMPIGYPRQIRSADSPGAERGRSRPTAGRTAGPGSSRSRSRLRVRILPAPPPETPRDGSRPHSTPANGQLDRATIINPRVPRAVHIRAWRRSSRTSHCRSSRRPNPSRAARRLRGSASRTRSKCAGRTQTVVAT